MIRLFLLLFLALFVESRTVIPSKHAEISHDLVSLFNVKKSIVKREDDRVVCQTEECKEIAKMLKDNMDRSVDPCDDFYEFACGNWEKNNPLPEDEIYWSIWSIMQKKIHKEIEDILEGGPKSDDILPVKLAKRWYSSCMNVDRIEKRGVEPFITTMARVGGWPLAMEEGEWDADENKWQKVDDYYAHLIGKNSFHHIYVYDLRDYMENMTEKILTIESPHLPPTVLNILMESEDTSDEDDSDEDGSMEPDSKQDSREPGSEEEFSREQDEESEEDVGNGNEEENDENDEGNDENDDEGNEEEETTEGNEKEETTEGNEEEETTEKTEEEGDEEKKRAKGKLVKKTKKHKHMKQRKHAKKHQHMNQRKHAQKKLKKHKHAGGKKVKVEHKVKRTKRHIPVKNIHHVHASRHNVHHQLRKHKVAGGKKQHLIKKGRPDKRSESSEGETTDSTSTETSDEDKDDDLSLKDNYKNYILEVAKTMAKERGADLDQDKLNKDVDDLIEFQIKLGKALQEGVDDDITNITLGDFQKWYNSLGPKSANAKVNWEGKIKGLYNEANVELDDDVVFSTGEMKYFENLRTLLEDTPSEVIVNHIHWNFLTRVMKAGPKRLRDMSFSWSARNWFDDDDDDSDGEESLNKRSSRCLSEVEMSDIVAYEFVRKHFNDDIRTVAMDMIDDIQKEVEHQVKEADWMEEETKDFILEKLVEMEKFVGYPDWYRNETVVKLFFRGLTIGPSYYENTLTYMRYYKWKILQSLVRDYDIEGWLIDPVTLNAFFLPDENSITITAADFQSPMFSYNRPSVINYGIIGLIMAHEVNHAFDDSGRYYDRHGNEMEWLSTMAEAYSRRAECFVEQFNRYSLDKSGDTIIENYGNNTVDENIADTMGMEAVFRAYRRRERECGKPNEVLPGLEEYNNDQLFFLSFANLWCEVVDPEFLKLTALFDSHSTGRLRVIGSVSNSNDFAEAFNCPVGSPMNPEKKCNIWK